MVHAGAEENLIAAVLCLVRELGRPNFLAARFLQISFGFLQIFLNFSRLFSPDYFCRSASECTASFSSVQRTRCRVFRVQLIEKEALQKF